MTFIYCLFLGPINSGFSVDDDNSSVYSNSSIKARDQLGGLAESQLQELCMDIYDELERRNDYSTFISRQRHEIQYGQECPPTSLQPNSEFSERRNDARAKLAIMPNSKFRMLLGELVPELIKRYPTLKTPSITSSGNSSSSNTPHGRNNNGYEHSGYGNSSQNASPATSGFRQMDNAFSAMQMSNHAPDSRPSNPVLHVPPAPTSPKKSYTATGQHLNPMQAYEQRTDSANTSSSSLFTGNSKNPFSSGFDSKHSTSSSANHSMQFTPDKQAYDTMYQLIEQQKEQISSYKQQIDKLTKDNQHLLGMINELMEYFKTPSKN